MSGFQGSISMDTPSGSGGPLSPGQAVNGLSIDALGRVVLGQDVGEAGNPAILLSPRQVPVGTLSIEFDLAASSSFTIDNDDAIIKLFRNNSGLAAVIQFTTQQGNNPGGNPYGNFFMTMDDVYDNPDGQEDAVMMWGYNQNGGGANLLPNEAAIWWAIESHFQTGGSEQFEVHLQAISKMGNINRYISITPNKISGAAIGFSQIDSYAWEGTNGGIQYFSVDSGGNLQLLGPATHVTFFNTSPTAGQLEIAPQATGPVKIVNGTTSADNNIEFDNGLIIANTSAAQDSLLMELPDISGTTAERVVGTITSGFAHAHVIGVDAPQGVFDIYQNTNPAGPSGILYVVATGTGSPFMKLAYESGGSFIGYNFELDQTDANKLKIRSGNGTSDIDTITMDELGHVGVGGVTAPSAWLQLPPGDGAPGNGALKFSASTLLAAVENGVLEYDGTHLYFTTGGVRLIIV